MKYENVIYVWGEFHSYLQVYSIKSEVVIWNSWVLIRYMKKDVDFFLLYILWMYELNLVNWKISSYNLISFYKKWTYLGNTQVIPQVKIEIKASTMEFPLRLSWSAPSSTQCNHSVGFLLS